MAKIVAVGFNSAEGNPTQTVNLQDMLCSRRRCADKDVRLFSNADLVPNGVEGGAFEMSVEREIVETTIGETIAVI